MDLFPAHVLIDGIPAAGVVLSENGDILATNPRMSILIGSSPKSSGLDALLGHNSSTLPVVITPLTKPVLRDWTALLEAAKLRLGHDFPSKDLPLGFDDLAGESQEVSEHDRDTASFWNSEDRKELAMVDVLILQQVSGLEDGLNAIRRRIRARMCVRAISHSSVLRYIVTFRRPTNYRSSTVQVQHMSKSQLPKISIPEVNPQDEADIATLVAKLIPSCMSILDADGQVIWLSDSWYDFTGLPKQDALGSAWTSAIHPDDVEQMVAEFTEVIKTGQSHWSCEVRHRASNGEYKYFLARVSAVKDEQGKIQKYYASMLDVNDLVVARLESDLRNQAVMTLLSKADVSLWGIDQAQNMYVREGTLPWDPTQYPKRMGNIATHAQQCEQDCIPSGGPSNVNGILQDLLHGKPFQSSLEHQEGDRWYRTRFVADTNRGLTSANDQISVTSALGLTIDITDVKARAQLQIDNDGLATSSRAASEATELKSRFLANMSHEIRTPIAGIIGLSEIMRDTDLNKEQRQLSVDISTSATFLLSLVNDILDFSKIEAGHMDIEAVPFSLSQVTTSLHQLMTLASKRKGLLLSFRNCLPENTIIVGDPGRLQQILTNLLSNAIKFTSSGSVTLTIDAIKSRPKLSELRSSSMVSPRGNTVSRNSFFSERDEVVVEFTVKDCGCGIDSETMAKLFRPFSQADSSTARMFGGTGLGLTISRELVELMGGKIQLHSVPSVGTTAVFSIPYQKSNKETVLRSTSHTDTLQKPTHEATIPSYEKIDEFQTGTVKTPQSSLNQSPVNSMSCEIVQSEIQPRNNHVLVVEDNFINQKIALITLKRLGFTATAVCNGQEAIEHLTATTTHSEGDSPNLPNIILMDCMMPVMDGYKATRMLRSGESVGGDKIPEAISRIPIIAMTASTTKGDRERCEQAGMNDYLSKPVVRDELERVLKKWITHE